MSEELSRLKRLLVELFQLDTAEDLDFGMYRVLRLRRAELTRFLDDVLTDEATKAIGAMGTGERAELEARLREIERQAASYGGSAEKSREYQELCQRLAFASDAALRERQVYAHLAEFFSRYYDEGDFLSLPRLRADTYAIPYDGSEVVPEKDMDAGWLDSQGELGTRLLFTSRPDYIASMFEAALSRR